MRGVVYAFVALAFAAMMPHPVAAQCYGPECDRNRSGPPAYYDERPTYHSNSPNNGQPNNGQPYRSAPYDQGRRDQGRPYPPTPYSQPNYSQPNYQQPDYQGQPRSPTHYSDFPPGVAPPARDYRRTRPDGRIEHRTQTTTQVTRTPKAARHPVRQRQPALDRRQAARGASATADGGQVTISMAEYRELQSQARELQRLLSVRGGVPDRRTRFPDVRLPAAGNAPARL